MPLIEMSGGGAGAGVVQKSGNRVRWHPRLFDASSKPSQSSAASTPKDPVVVDLSGGDEEQQITAEPSAALTAAPDVLASEPKPCVGESLP
jgi:hypothetical protein